MTFVDKIMLVLWILLIKYITLLIKSWLFDKIIVLFDKH